MAIKPTIYKVQLQIADGDRNCYQQAALTVALHPSETIERLLARLLAYALFYEPGLEFSKGLSTSDEPAIWRHADNGVIEQWIEMGQPEESRIRKGLARANTATVVAFGKSVDIWWRLQGEKFSDLSRVEVWQLPWQQMVTLAAALTRATQLSVSVSGGVVYADVNGSCEDFEISLLSPSAD
ncbi:MAG: hypothetical protein ACI9GW_002966 [Halieaceae bacterium]|jgi:uncharacterized protein YaeQ